MPQRIEGTVVSFSSAGNLVTDVSAAMLQDAPHDERVTVRCDEHETIGLFAAEHQQPESTLIALLGSSGFLELEIVGDSAKIMLGVPLGEKVSVTW